MRRSCAVIVTWLVCMRGARAEHGLAPAPPGEDEVLYACHKRTAEVSVTFKPEAEVKDLIAWALGFTCKNFVLDPRVVATGKKVTLMVPNKMAPPEAYRLFLTALATINLAVVTSGSALRVVEAPAARREALPIARKGVPDPGDQFVRYVIKPSYLPPEALRQALAAIKSDAGDVAVAGAWVLVTDDASHVREMLAFEKLIDVPGGTDGLYTIQVYHADAAKLADKLGQLLSLPAGGGAPARPAAGPDGAAREVAVTPSKIVVDERTNTLLVAASEPGYERVKALVERLDIALDIEGGTSIHVYPLGSAIAEELAKVLTSAISEPAHAARPAGASAAPAAPPGLDALGATLEGQARVIADKATNALIVMASTHDFLAIRELLRQLDQPRRQVYIEAMILEVDVSDATSLGTMWHGGSAVGTGGATVLGGLQLEKDTKSYAPTAALGTLLGGVGGVVGEATTVLGVSIPSYAVLFQALANHASVHVLSSPSIIAVDNELAKYKIGTTIPVPTTTSFAPLTGGTQTPGVGSRSVDHKELPLVLEIKPHISIDDTVLLEVAHSAMEKVDDDKELGPTWSTRSMETRVVVRDQETVVIGGLMQERDQHTTAKIPLLGDLPLVGNLFRSTRTERRKTNLIVMLTPYIARSQGDLQAIRLRKQREHDEFVRSEASLAAMPYEPAIDYGRKRGLLEEINRALADVEQEAEARRAVVRAPGVPAGVIEVPTTP
jgi:general secretion pathway protein D